MTVFSYHELKKLVYQMLNEYIGIQSSESGMAGEVLRNQEEYRRMLSNGIRACCSGNYGAREMVKELIRSYLIRELVVTEERVKKLLPVGDPEKLSARQMFEILVYMLDKDAEEGFGHLWRDAGWDTEAECITITEEMIREYYQKSEIVLDYNDIMMVLSQMLFADTVGLGAIDTINYQKGCIEEIQLGMNGLTEKVYNYKDEMVLRKEGVFYARDGIHILIRGKTVWLRFLGFGTEVELKRVLRNLIKDSRAGELTRNHPMIVVDTIDGRRVSVSRPPMTDSWVGLIRKFDTMTGMTLESLYASEKDGSFLAKLLGWLVRSGRNIAITGEMASGKTTLFRACLQETAKDRNLRIIEVDSFEMNVRSFLPERNSVTMRVTDETPAEEVLAFARKTTGQIFAVGEISSAAVAVMMMDLSKIATQLFFSAHYVSTEQMIVDFVNAKLCMGGYTEEALAQMDVLQCLGFDIHLQNRFGRRCIRYINEIVADNRGGGKNGYQLRTIYRFDETRNCGVFLEKPDERTFLRAREEMSPEEFAEFSAFFMETEAWK